MQEDFLQDIFKRGYKLNNEIIVPSKELLDIVAYLESLSLKEKKMSKVGLSTILRSSKLFLNQYYDLHYVPVLIGKRFIRKKKMNPFYIPLVLVSSDENYASLVEELVIRKGVIRLYSKYIELPIKLNEISILSYTHEITHTQLNHMLGLVQEYNNSELLSIFNEFLHAYTIKDDEELLRAYESSRLLEFISVVRWLEEYAKNKNEEDRISLIEGSSYCESTIKACYLFMQYYYGDQLTKDLILYSIQRVFDGKITLEEVLDELDITFIKSQDIKMLTKYMER